MSNQRDIRGPSGDQFDLNLVLMVHPIRGYMVSSRAAFSNGHNLLDIGNFRPDAKNGNLNMIS